MHMCKAVLAAAAIVLVFGARSAEANNLLIFDASMDSVDLGQTFDVTLSMSFPDDTLGGAVDLLFDTALLRLDDIRFSDALGDDRDFRCPTDPIAPSPVPCPTDPNFMSWGDFAGLTGDLPVANLLFTAISLGSTDVTGRLNRNFSDFQGGALAIEFMGASVTIVPEPGTVALLGLGLGGLALARRRC